MNLDLPFKLSLRKLRMCEYFLSGAVKQSGQGSAPRKSVVFSGKLEHSAQSACGSGASLTASEAPSLGRRLGVCL